MRRASRWASGIVLIAGATAGVVAACYNDVPAPSAPLPPTREVPPQGPQPGPLVPPPAITADGGITPIGSRVIELNPRFAPESEPPPAPSPTQEVRDAGVADVIDLPPVPDAPPEVPLDAPGVKVQ